MPIRFTCPHCGQQTTVADQFAGQSGPCASCGNEISIPHVATAPAAVPSEHSASGAAVVVIVAGVLLMIVLCGGAAWLLMMPVAMVNRTVNPRMQCSNHLKQIAVALHMYHDMYGSFPPANVADENGKPMHSWRVLLLPFMEQDAIYDQYDMSKPWDSPENQAVVQQLVPYYCCPDDDDGTSSQDTSYMVVVGQGCIFDGERSTKISQITDGTANTIIVVEVTGSGVHWAEPVDLPLDQLQQPGQPGSPGSLHSGGFNVAMGDGSVRFMSDATSLAELRSLLLINDGAPVAPPP